MPYIFPERLQRLRERRKMPRWKLAECCGISKTALGRYERGERQPTIEAVWEIADYFEVSVDYLIGRQNYP